MRHPTFGFPMVFFGFPMVFLHFVPEKPEAEQPTCEPQRILQVM
jgi:hypothetical protein